MQQRNSHILIVFAEQALYGGLYSRSNVALSGIHTHSGPGGYLQYVLYTITSLGFVRESFDTLVEGVVEVCAHGGVPSMAVQRLCLCYRAHQCGLLALVMGAHSRAGCRGMLPLMKSHSPGQRHTWPQSALACARNECLGGHAGCTVYQLSGARVGTPVSSMIGRKLLVDLNAKHQACWS